MIPISQAKESLTMSWVDYLLSSSLVNYCGLAVLAFILSSTLSGTFRNFSVKKKWYEKAPVGKTGAVPILGGVAVYLSILSFLVVKYWQSGWNADYLQWIIASSGIFLIGLYDDIYGTQMGTRQAFKVGATALIIFSEKPFSQGFFSAAWPTWAVIPLVTCWVLSVTHGFRSLDRFDGMGSTVFGVTSLLIGVFCVFHHESSELLKFVSFVSAGAALGPWAYGLSRNRIALGSSGTLLLGFILGIASMKIPKVPSSAVFSFVPFYFVAVPFMDFLLASSRRSKLGMPTFREEQAYLVTRLLKVEPKYDRVHAIVVGTSVGCGLVAFVAAYGGFAIQLNIFILTCFGLYIGLTKISQLESKRQRTRPERAEKPKKKQAA